MLSQQALKEILELISRSQGTFVVLEREEPRLVVLDYNLYQKLVSRKSENGRKIQKQTMLVTGTADFLAKELVKGLEAEGHEVVGVDDLSMLMNQSELDAIFSQHRFDVVFHLAESAGRKQSQELSDFYFVNNVEASLILLKTMSKYGVDKMIYKSAYGYDSIYDRSKILFEDVLNFYHHALGINSVSLRLPAISFAQEFATESEIDAFLIDNPIGAVLAAARGDTSCLSVPKVESADQTPEVELIDLASAARAFNFAKDYLNQSSGSMIFNVLGFKSTIGQIISKAVDVTQKMIPTKHADQSSLWQMLDAKEAKTLQSAGFSVNIDLDDLIVDLWGAQDEIQDTALPIALSELLTGKYTPFIKPHNS